jgi:hypothetical protein
MLKRFFTFLILALACLVILLPSISIPSVCMFVSESATGMIYTLDHCYTVTFSAGAISYSRQKCVYQSTTDRWLSKEFDRDYVNRC